MKAIKSIVAAITVTAALVAPMTAYASEGAAAGRCNAHGRPAQSQRQAAHREGDPVVVGEDWGTPVYAEWHRGDSGRWWATFWTHNWTRVYAAPAPAGCGWTFHCYDEGGDWVQVVRCEESSAHGEVGPQGVPSHWQELGGSRWF